MRFDGFCGPTYQSWSPNVSNERTINLYPEIMESAGAKSKVALYGTPGLTLFTTLSHAPVRALWAGEDRLFAVGGDHYYEVFEDPVANPPTDRSAGTGGITIGDDAQHTPVAIWPNGTQNLIVSAGQAYIDGGPNIVPATMDTSAAGKANSYAAPGIAWVSGDKFGAWMVGQTLTLGGATYTVSAFGDEEYILVSPPYPPVQANVDFSISGHLNMAARTGCFLDTYFIIAPPDSKTFYFSNPNDGTAWDGLEVSVKEAYPDNIAAVYADHEELYLFGTHWSTEVWRNEGAADAAGGFVRDPGGFVHIGCVAPWSIQSLASGLHFLGGDTRGRTVAYRLQGFQPVRVSTHAVEQVWSTYSTVWDAYSYAYTDEGHEFWVLNFQTANATWVYDVASQMWHERAYWNGTSFERHRGRCHAFVWGKHFVGDWANGNIYEMKHGIFTDNGVPIHRVRQAPHLSNEEVHVFHHRLQLDAEINGTAPSFALDWSDDDGTTWNTPKTRAPSVSGNKGRYLWNRLGTARDRIYRVTTSDAAKVAIVDAILNPAPTSGAH